MTQGPGPACVPKQYFCFSSKAEAPDSVPLVDSYRMEPESGWHEFKDGDWVVIRARGADGEVYDLPTQYAGIIRSPEGQTYVHYYLHRADWTTDEIPIADVVDIELVERIEDTHRSGPPLV